MVSFLDGHVAAGTFTGSGIGLWLTPGYWVEVYRLTGGMYYYGDPLIAGKGLFPATGMNWGNAGPVITPPSTTIDNDFMVIFTATLNVPQTGAYRFQGSGDDGTRISIMDPLRTPPVDLINWAGFNGDKTVSLQAGVDYDYVQMWRECGGGASFGVTFTPPAGVIATLDSVIFTDH